MFESVDPKKAVCTKNYSPAEIEPLLDSSASETERKNWQTHRQDCPACRQTWRADAALHKIFAAYRADPFFVKLAADQAATARTRSGFVPEEIGEPFPDPEAVSSPKISHKDWRPGRKKLGWQAALVAGLVLAVTGLVGILLAGISGLNGQPAAPASPVARFPKVEFASIILRQGSLVNPGSLAVGPKGTLFLADASEPLIQRIDSQGRLVQEWSAARGWEGQPGRVSGMVVDGQGNFYTLDPENYKVNRFDSSGVLLAGWGQFQTGDSQLILPKSLALDRDGNVWVTDMVRHKVKKFSPDGKLLLEFGSFGSGMGQFNLPSGIAIDTQGNLYLTDNANNRVEKFDSQGNLLLSWGSKGTETGQFQSPRGVALDRAGNVYVVDSGNNRVQVFDAEGRFILSWGGQGTANGQFNDPADIALDDRPETGNVIVYVLDNGNRRVQQFQVK